MRSEILTRLNVLCVQKAYTRSRVILGGLTALCLLCIGAFSAGEAHAQGLIRDTEIEEVLREYTNPILRAAGLNPQSVNIYIVNDRELNAFVTRGQNIFLHTGLIIRAQTPNALKGVIAHEAAHIAEGHLARSSQGNRNAYAAILIAAGLGLAAILAGEGAAGAAILAGSTQFGQLEILAYTRVNEASADLRASQYLEKTGQSTHGLIAFFDNFRYQEHLSYARRFEYFRSHPLSTRRIEVLRGLTEKSKFNEVKDNQKDVFNMQMMKAKLIGFIDAPQTVFNKFPLSDDSLPAHYARAVAYYRAADLQSALKSIDVLIARLPTNPYFHELKGQIFYESAQGANAIAPLREALRLKPNAPLLQVALAQALIEDVKQNSIALELVQAIDLLKRALHTEPTNGFAWYQLSQAYDRQKKPALARYAIAEQAFVVGDLQRAASFARRAISDDYALPRAQRRRASDILIIAETDLSKTKRKRRRR